MISNRLKLLNIRKRRNRFESNLMLVIIPNWNKDGVKSPREGHYILSDSNKYYYTSDRFKIYGS